MDGPISHRRLSSLRVHDARAISRDLWRRNALVEASAMAFSLFLASIPLMALSGMVLANVLRNEAQALWLVSSLVDLAPAEVRALVDNPRCRGMLSAVNRGASGHTRSGARRRAKRPETPPTSATCDESRALRTGVRAPHE
jgi:hypothetical protein